MDIAGKDTNVVPEQKSNEHVNYHSPNIHSDWRVNENPTNTSIEMVAMGSTVMESSTCSSAPVVDSFGPHTWDHQFNAQALGYCDMNVQYNAGTSSSLGPVRAETGWHQGAVLKGVMFQPSFPTMLPQSLPHLPSDSAFIERAARYSCFGGGSFGQMMNPFILSNPPLNHCDVMRGPHEFLGGNSVKPLPGMAAQGCGMHVAEISKEGLFRGKCEVEEGSPLKKSGSFVASLDEAKYPIGVSAGHESDEAEFSGHGTQEELGSPPGESSLKGLGSKKRKRGGQDNGLDDNYETPQLSVETANENEEIKRKGDQNPIKTGVKHAKQGSQGSDPTKEGYVHIRARRGQATNSHSLAERVRREKISERMKFLQDLVPGCSKVTGKAVMLDEIINYVQSLQRQVELATVNPRLDFNIEGFVTKDMLQPRPGMPSSLVFPPDMTTIPFPPLHPSQHGAVQTALPVNSSETFPRPVHLPSNDACEAAPDVWEDELHNIVHMGFN